MNALRLRNFTGLQLLVRLAIMVAGAMFFTTRTDAQPIVLNDGGLTTINGVTNDYRNQPNNWWIVIGTNFPNTRVLVSNAGWLVDDGAIVGAGVNSSFNNVTITGAGSQWRSFRIDLGVQGSANTVTNINGGQTRVNSDIKLGTEVTSHSNVFEVIGNGSSLHQGADLFAVGYRGSYNRMIIRSGGDATNHASGAIGYHGTSSNNTVEVTGAGSTWSVTRHLDIGYAGDNNALVISNGAYMDSSWQSSANFQGASIGALAGSDNNRALVTGPGSRWSFSTQEGTLLEVGNRGSGNTLTVSNGGLINMGYSVAKLNVIAGFNDGSIQNQILVTGAGSAISNNGYLAVGFYGDNNTMEIRGGGRISNLDGYIGYFSSTGNQVVVDGAGSVWSNRYELIVGYDGADNRLVITNGGFVISATNTSSGLTTIGENSGANRNTVVVDGSASRWNVASTLRVGKSGRDNVLGINNSAIVNAGSVILGSSGGISNVVRLRGGSLLTDHGVTVNNTCRLEGYGLVAGAVTIASGGILSPGITTGILTNIGNVTFNSGSIFAAEVNGTTPGTQHDQLVVQGSVTLNNATLNVTPGFAPAFYTEVVIIQNDGVDPVNGQFNGLPEGATVAAFGGVGFAVSYVGGTGNDVVLIAVPSGPIYWTGDFQGAGDYHTAARWSPNFVPRIYDNANFTNAGSVTWTSNAVAAHALFNMTAGGASAVSQNIGNYTWNLTGSYIVGQNPGADARVLLNSGNLVVTNVSGTALFEVRRGTFFFSGGLIDADQLVMTNSAGQFNFFNGTLITRGGRIDHGADFRVGASGSGATWDLQGNGTTTIVANAVTVGSGGSQVSLLITNGATLMVTGNSPFSWLGGGTASTNNRILISGPGSRWENNNHLWSQSAGNSLEISNGGSLRVGQDLNFGRDGSNYASISNLITVTGSGSSLVISNTLTLGYDSPQNELVISAGGLVSNEYSYLGSQSQSGNNRATVTGAGSRWVHSQDLAIGSSGAGNSLVVSSGGSVVNREGNIGYFGGSSNNQVTVTGSGSTWSNSFYLYVGNQESGNELLIAAGGRVTAVNGYLGAFANANNNRVTIDGYGSSWNLENSLYAGFSGSFNTLVITNGGQAVNRDGSIGRIASAFSNRVIVTGANSLWVNSNSLSVGESGSFSSLRIEKGGRVENNTFGIGSFSSSSNNSVVVDGPQSMLANHGDAYLGISGSFNSLMVTNGATVVNSNSALIGYSATSYGNQVTVTGSGSLWTNSGTLWVGYNGSGNTLLIADGGHAIMSSGQVGSFDGLASNNLVRLSGGTMTVSSGLTVSTNNTLAGSGFINGPVLVYGVMSPGASIGTLVFSQTPSIVGELRMEISKSGGLLTNDLIQTTNSLYYNGTLTVSDIGPDALSAGDSFKLFDALSYSGSFVATNLPALAEGLSWTNTLIIDGRITVLGEAGSTFGEVRIAGNNLVFDLTGGSVDGSWTLLTTTNLMLSLENWTTNDTGNFSDTGRAVITNAIDPAHPHQFYRLREP